MAEDKSLKLEVESFGNYACRSREQIRRWRNFTAFTADGKKIVKTKFVPWFCRDNSSFVR